MAKPKKLNNRQPLICDASKVLCRSHYAQLTLNGGNREPQDLERMESGSLNERLKLTAKPS